MKMKTHVEGGKHKHKAQVPPAVFVLNVERVAHEFVCGARRAELAACRCVLCRLFDRSLRSHDRDEDDTGTSLTMHAGSQLVLEFGDLDGQLPVFLLVRSANLNSPKPDTHTYETHAQCQ